VLADSSEEHGCGLVKQLRYDEFSRERNAFPFRDLLNIYFNCKTDKSMLRFICFVLY